MTTFSGGVANGTWRSSRLDLEKSTGLKTGHYKSRLEGGATKGRARRRRKVAATK